MARKERGLFRMIFRDFLNSVTPRISKRICVGEDYMGTKYYEITETKVSIHKKPNRYFVPKEKDDFEQELPAEWEAWLRGRRKVPPTVIEVMHLSLLYIIITVEYLLLSLNLSLPNFFTRSMKTIR